MNVKACMIKATGTPQRPGCLVHRLQTLSPDPVRGQAMHEVRDIGKLD